MTVVAPPGKLTRQRVLELASERFPAATILVRPNSVPCLLVEAAHLIDVMQFLRDDPALDFKSLSDLAGVDLLKWPGEKKGEFLHSELMVVYQLHSLNHRHHATVKVILKRDTATVPSVAGLWPVAGWFEREAFDLYGITFSGHADLRRLLTPEDWTGFPLRKDYAYPESYGGVALKREGQHFDAGPYA